MTQPFGLPWGRVVAIAAAFAVVDELLVVPLFARLFDLSTQAGSPLGSRIGWAFLGALAIVAGLAFVARRARATTEQLFVALFVILAGLQFAARAQAAYFFEPDVSAVGFTGVTVQLLLMSALLAAAVAFTLRVDASSQIAHDPPTGFGLSDLQWLWRIPASGAIYFVLFFAAGLIIWPFVQDFYAPQLEAQRLGLLNFEWEYLNGIWFALIALPLIRLVPGSWWRAGVTLGVAFCLIRSIGALIVPNPHMPTSIRFWHMFEVGWSNFVYGLAIAYVFLPRRRRAEA